MTNALHISSVIATVTPRATYYGTAETELKDPAYYLAKGVANRWVIRRVSDDKASALLVIV